MLGSSDCPVYVLAGGESSRFGSNKAFVEIDGQPLLLRLTTHFTELNHSVFVVGKTFDQFRSLGIDAIEDKVPDAGPLSGLAAALEHRLESGGNGWILLANCDQLYWKSSWFHSLAQRATRTVKVVVYAARSGPATALKTNPLPGLYHTDLLTSVVERLSSRHLSLRELLGSSPTIAIEADPSPQAWSFNSREELSNLRLKLKASGLSDR